MTSMSPAKRIGPQHWSQDWFLNIMAVVNSLQGDVWLYRSRPRETGCISQAAQWRALLLVSRESDWSANWLTSIRWDQLSPDGTIVLRPQDEPIPVVVQLSSEALSAVKSIGNVRHVGGRMFVVAGTVEKQWRQILKLAGFDKSASPLPHWASFRQVAESPAEVVIDGKPQSLLGFYKASYFVARLSGKSKRTDELYRFTVRNFGRFLGHEPMLADLNDANLLGLLDWMRKQKSKHTGELLSSWSLAKEFDQLVAMWRFACAHHLVKDPPTVQRPPRPRKSPLAWTREEIAAIFKEIDAFDGYFTNGINIRGFWQALLYVMWVSGERITAILNLKWKHFDLKGGWLNVPAELRKGNTEDRLSKLPPYCVEALEAIASPQRELVFAWPFNMNYMWAKYGEILKRAGLPCDRKSKFHRIRKSVASHFAAAKGDATELMGHTSSEITRRHYLDKRIVVPVHAGDLLFRPDQPDNGGLIEVGKQPEQLEEVSPELAWL